MHTEHRCLHMRQGTAGPPKKKSEVRGQKINRVRYIFSGPKLCAMRIFDRKRTSEMNHKSTRYRPTAVVHSYIRPSRWLNCALYTTKHRHRFFQQPRNQPTPRRTELRHGASSVFLSAVRLGLRLPSIFRRRRSFPAGRSPAVRR
jgi:hypothetical protein